jgi:ATP-dependent Clp protease ATP-binding subunit ClpB
MTSNLGGEVWYQEENITREMVQEILHKQFRPEFLNRIDEIIIFHRLSVEDLVKIIDIQLKLMVDRIKDRGLTVQLEPEAIEYLAEVGYDPNFGARPLKRTIQREIMDPLAMKILTSEIKDGQNIVVKREKDHLIFEVT